MNLPGFASAKALWISWSQRWLRPSPAVAEPASPPLKPGLSRLLTTVLAAGLALGIYGRWLAYDKVPVTPAQDLAKHVAMALNFAAAVDDGQLLPRLQINHPQVPDIPIFQYYGFMTGMSAYPFLKCGLNGIQAVAASVVFLRAVSLLVLYAAARRLGLSQPAAWLAMVLFALEPYSISNLYGRVAISEYHAHSLLPALLWGYALLQTGRYKTGFMVIVLTCVLLALAHNIFFLYGSAFFVLLITASFLSVRIRVHAAFALLTAVLIATFQWLPAFLSTSDLNINFFLKNPHYNGYLTDGSGLIGNYQPLGQHGGEIRYFFTYSWWTLIGLFGVLFFLPVRGARLSLGLVGTLFLVISLGWFDVWSLLPRFTHALQFPYRLIPFASMVGCLGTAAMLDRLSRPAVLGLFGIVATISILPVLNAPAFPRFIGLSDQALMRDFASSDYVAADQGQANPASRIIASDLWLRDDNIIHGDGHTPIVVTLRVRSIFADRTISLSLENTNGPARQLSDVVAIAPGAGLQTITLVTNRVVRTAHIAPSEFLIPALLDHNIAGDRRRLSVYVDSMVVNDRPIVGFVKAELLTRSGLKRTFSSQFTGSHSSLTDLKDYVGLPTAYSRFLEARQDGAGLPVSSAADGSVLVQTISHAPIETAYRLPPVAVALSLLGLTAFLGGAFLIKDAARV